MRFYAYLIKKAICYQLPYFSGEIKQKNIDFAACLPKQQAKLNKKTPISSLVSCVIEKTIFFENNPRFACTYTFFLVPLQRKNSEIIRYELVKNMFRSGIKQLFMENLIGRTREKDELKRQYISKKSKHIFNQKTIRNT